jgi:hypothetical protein
LDANPGGGFQAVRRIAAQRLRDDVSAAAGRDNSLWFRE